MAESDAPSEPNDLPADLLADTAHHGEGKGKVRKDTNLIRRAFRERWPIPAETRERIAQRLATIVEQSEDERSAVGAARALIAADKLNQEQEKRDLEIPDRVDHTTGGQPLPPPPAAPPGITVTLADLDEVRSLLGLGAGGGPVPPHGGPKPVDPPRPAPQAAAVPPAR